MPLARSNTTSRNRSRSPAPPVIPQSPPQFQPPSYFAAAGGLKLPEKNKSQANSKPSSHVVFLSPQSPSEAASLDREFQSNSFTDSRKKRESQLANIPLVEMQLLPSMRDTINRMTRPPSRASSKTTPNLNLDSVWPVAAEELYCSSPRTPLSPPQDSCSTPTHISTESFSSSNTSTFTEPLTPKPSKSVLRSALRSPNPKPPKSENDTTTTASPSNGVTLKSVKSLLGRKSSGARIVEEKKASKVQATTTKLECESFTVIRPPNGNRSRSRTDPGTHPSCAMSSLPEARIPLPTTPQPPTKSFTSNIPRFAHRSKTPNTQSQTDDSDIEYRYEFEARRRRRLTVTNAKIPPYSSSEESEGDSVVSSPAGEAIGLGIRGIGAGVVLNDHDEYDHSYVAEEAQTKVPRVSIISYPSAGSIYTDEESEEGQLAVDMNMDSPDFSHKRRREALLGLVRGLDLNHTKSLSGGEESEYCGEDGVAVCISGSQEGLGGFESESEYEADLIVPVAEQRSLTPTTFERSKLLRPQSRSSIPPSAPTKEYTATATEPKHSSASKERGNRLSAPSTPKMPSSKDVSVTTVESKRSKETCLLPSSTSSTPGLGLSNSNSNEPGHLAKHSAKTARMSLPPIFTTARNTTTPKRKSLHYSFATSSPVPEPEPPLPMKTPARESLNYEAVLIAKRHREAAVRGREALGIPPSESDQTTTMSYMDSVVSTIDGDCWNNAGNDQLSVGAEALFRNLGRGDNTTRGSTTESKTDERERRKSQSRHRSGTRSPAMNDTARGHDDAQIHTPTLTSSVYTEIGEQELARFKIIHSLYTSEVEYTGLLGRVVQLFILPLRAQGTKTWISGVPPETCRLFDWLEDIWAIHVQLRDGLGVFDSSMQKEKKGTAVSVLQRFVAKMEVYQPYLVKLEGVKEILKSDGERSDSDFGEFIRMQENEGRLSLVRQLEEPIKRVGMYTEVFRTLLNTTPKTHEDYLPMIVLVRCTDLVVKTLYEVKAREREYEYIKDLAKRIDGLPLPLDVRERRLLCQGRLGLVVNASSSPSSSSESKSTPTHTARLANAIQEWNINRARSGSNASSFTYGSSSSSHSNTVDILAESPLAERYNSGNINSLTLNFPGRAESRLPSNSTRSQSHPVSTPAHPLEVFVFSDLVVFTQATPPGRLSRKGIGTATIVDDFGVARVLDVGALEDAETLELDLIPIRAEREQVLIKTISLSIPQTEGSKKKWLECFRKSAQSTLRALSDSVLGASYTNPDMENMDILEGIVKSGLPFPKSPSIQIPDDDSVHLEREERGWWSMRFQQVLREMREGVPVNLDLNVTMLDS